jgi:hypothetical protein
LQQALAVALHLVQPRDRCARRERAAGGAADRRRDRPAAVFRLDEEVLELDDERAQLATRAVTGRASRRQRDRRDHRRDRRQGERREHKNLRTACDRDGSTFLGPPRRRPRPLQVGVVLEHPPLELLQLEPGLDAELLAQCLARAAVELERVGLPARAVEREHQLRPWPLPEGLLRDQLFELRDEARVAAQREVCVDALLERREPLVLEPCAGVTRERLRELGQRWTAPERERLAEPLRSRLRVARSEEIPPLACEPLEAV